jgi:hypothetical protein
MQRKDIKFPNLPDGLRSLRIGPGNAADLKLPPGSQMLACEDIRFNTPCPLPNGLRALIITGGHSFSKNSVINWLPPSLEHFDLKCVDIAEISFLPESLRFLEVGPNLYRMPELPEGLQELVIGDNRRIGKIAKLPRKLKTLYLDDCKIALPGELPPELEEFICAGTVVPNWEKLPRLPDNLRLLNIKKTGFSGILEIPSGMRVLEFSSTKIEEIVWRGKVPPLKIFIGDKSLLCKMPELPEDISEISVYGCKLVGAWTGYFSNLCSLNCSSNKLTELPNIARAKYLSFSDNNLTHIPSAGRLRKRMDPAAIAELHGSGAVIPSLLELAGEVVIRYYDIDGEEIPGVHAYLNGFRECAGCGGWCILRKKYCKTTKGVSTVSFICRRCAPDVKYRRKPPAPYERTVYRDRHLTKLMGYRCRYEYNDYNWFTIES